jgi:hypothetical protein
VKDHQQIGRLAMREEGDEWKAYYALPDTMNGAIFLGSIKMRFVEIEERKAAFMGLMREAVADLIEQKVGERPVWGGPKAAPFWERGQMTTLHIIGAALADEIFVTDPKIYGSEINWNVTRIRAAAEAGKFGKPHRRAMAILPAMSRDHHSNIDWDIVNAMVASHKAEGAKSIIHQPCLVVTVRIGVELHRIIADGNKRICARRLAGFGTWEAFIVPPGKVERQYRVLFEETKQ